MLTRLSIRDVVLIEALDLDFERGLGVLTGETGAGKSILLDALGLALGGRSASGLVRQGAIQAQVTASFAPTAPALALLGNNDLSIDPGEPLIVRRTVKADGGSRAFVNDQPVSAALLRDLGTMLVEIHGQHDDRGLINPRGHRALLDSFARADTAGVAKAHAAMREADTALDAAIAALDTASRDREWLDHAVEELRAFAPEAGEEEILAERRAAMQRGERVAADLGDVVDYRRIRRGAEQAASGCARA
jgi:DNA repair protein RecN (Recombination protein N)